MKIKFVVDSTHASDVIQRQKSLALHRAGLSGKQIKADFDRLMKYR
jgi:hypothetical protein